MVTKCPFESDVLSTEAFSKDDCKAYADQMPHPHWVWNMRHV